MVNFCFLVCSFVSLSSSSILLLLVCVLLIPFFYFFYSFIYLYLFIFIVMTILNHTYIIPVYIYWYNWWLLNTFSEILSLLVTLLILDEVPGAEKKHEDDKIHNCQCLENEFVSWCSISCQWNWAPAQVTFDNTMNMSMIHISNLCKTVNFHIKNYMPNKPFHHLRCLPSCCQSNSM